MKFLTWNCNGAFRKKAYLLDDLELDIYIIQECENPKIYSKEYKEREINYLWKGNNKNKGLGIFAKDNIKLKMLNWSDKNYKYKNEELELLLPCLVDEQFIILAVWTKHANSEVFGYIGQLWKYLQLHKNKLKEYPCFIIGDFNSNKIWDKWDRWWNHSDVVKELEEIDIISFYHYLNNEKQGEEENPTFYLQRKLEKAYHIDYIFGTKKLLKKETKCKILNESKWIEVSDHLPLMLNI